MRVQAKVGNRKKKKERKEKEKQNWDRKCIIGKKGKKRKGKTKLG